MTSVLVLLSYGIKHFAPRASIVHPAHRQDLQVSASRVEPNGGAKSAGRRGVEGGSQSKVPHQVEEAVPAEAKQDGVGFDGGAPRRYRLSINLASVKDLDNATHVVRLR